MLSIKAFKSAGSAKEYYSHGDYYGKEGEGVWLGEGAKELGLEGTFNAKNDKEFENLLKGHLPTGQVLGQRTSEGIKHRPGVDLTFSCPKSFSIEMLINANPETKKALDKALNNALSKTLSFIEKEGFVITRSQKGGKEREAAEKLAFATFKHTTNRNLEPQMHVHCFLANAVKGKDGKYRSITVDQLLENNKFIGQVFRNELALEVKSLGYDIRTTILSDGNSSFELSKIDSKLIDAFSTRRKEIEKLCKELGITTKEGRDAVVINSRKAKKLVKEEELVSTWKEVQNNIVKEIEKEGQLSKATSSEIDQKKSIIDRIAEKLSISKEKEAEENQAPLTTKELAKICIEDVSNTKSVFTQSDLIQKMLKYNIGNTTTKDIQKEITKLEKAGTLIRVDNQYTTKDLLNKEKQILSFAEKGRGMGKEIINEKQFDKRCQSFELREKAKNTGFQMNDQQRKALKHILTSKDKIIAIEGLPGVGKSTVLNGVRDISGRKLISLIGLGEKYQGNAPTASAAKTLKESAKLSESNTLHSFLGKYNGYIEDRGTSGSLASMKREFKNTVVFLDEGSLVSTKTMWSLLKLQDKFGFKLVLTGDIGQLNAVEAGKPFEQILKVIPSVKINQIVRQKSELHKEAVIAASEGKVDKTFEVHKDSVHNAGNNTKKLAESAISSYMSLPKESREQTLLTANTRKLRDKINEGIRDNLTKAGELKKEAIDHNALRQTDLTATDLKFATSFTPGDVLKFNKDYKNGIKVGDYLKVINTNEVTNSLTLEKNGKKILYYLKKDVNYENKFEVFKEKNIQLQEGLKIRFTKNNNKLGLVNSETAYIHKINKDKVTLKLEDGAVKELTKEQLKHIDYGYCTTVYASQGKTLKNVIAALSSNKWLNNQKAWCVAISRHKENFTVLVEDKEKLYKCLVNNKGDRLSAIELASGSAKEQQNNLQIRHKNTNLNSKGIDLEV